MSQQITRTDTSVSPFTVLLSATRKGARLARLLGTERIRSWGLPHETAALIIAELAANAALHGRVPGRNFRLTLSVTGNALRIEVRDPRVERLPTVRPASEPEAPRECGHGLLLVEELADRWGVVPELIGKTVWAELDGTPCTGLTGTKRDSRWPTGGTYGRGGR
ncbi:ATP-binding protein [Streptomyces sp. 6N106]|uniref:ATP-binding protein n=1 Tax=Streptomyces sp. 6N106 TaxID=3457418 RepID=UPI003FD6BD10